MKIIQLMSSLFFFSFVVCLSYSDWALAVVAGSAFVGLVCVGMAQSPSGHDRVPPPKTSFAPEQYSGEELYLNVPYYLEHFPKLANAVVESGPDRGFIDLHVWRTPFDRTNLRTMENHAAFAYFYTEDAPWNPYRGDPAVRERLEAVLTFLNERVGPNGEVTEYGADRAGLCGDAGIGGGDGGRAARGTRGGGTRGSRTLGNGNQ